MAENNLKFRIRRMLRSTLNSCKSKEQIFDVVLSHRRRQLEEFCSPQPPHPLAVEAAESKLPFLSPVVSGRKCPPASPAISPFHSNNFYGFPKEKKNVKNKKKRRSIRKCAGFEDRFPDCKYVNGLLSSEDEEEEEEFSLSSQRRAAVEDSMAVVKRSSDPYNDFWMSMVEMIVENNIFAAKDLVNLLRCFLSLNSHHHHKLIIQVFAEIWEAFFSHGTCYPIHG